MSCPNHPNSAKPVFPGKSKWAVHTKTTRLTLFAKLWLLFSLCLGLDNTEHSHLLAKINSLIRQPASLCMKLFWRAAGLVLDLRTRTLTLTATTSLSMACYYLYFYLSPSIAALGIEAKAWPIQKSLWQLIEPPTHFCLCFYDDFTRYFSS